MKRFATYAVHAVVLLGAAMLAVGCCDKENKQINDLKMVNQQLDAKNKESNAELANARSRESQLMGQLESKDTTIMALQTENMSLKSKGAAPVPPTPGKPGGETTVYAESVGADVLFDAGKATLTQAGKTRLDAIAATIRSKYPGMTVRVMGYTDNDPIVKTKNLWKDNLDLSANRAMEVTRHLWSKGISAEHIETVGMGATHFVESNTSKNGKAANRRVEILVVKK